MARSCLNTACKAACLARKPVPQYLGASFMGLRQLWNPAAEVSDGITRVSQAVAPAVECDPQQSSAQLLRHQAAAFSAVEGVQLNITEWPDTQQHDQDEAHLILIQLKQTGHWIKKQTQHLRSQSRGQHFDKALRRFYADVLAMCANSESCVNHIHLTAILGGLAKAWAAADVCHVVQTQQQAVEDLHRFTAKILALLQPVCKALRTREASNLLLSLATLSIDPSSMVPGTLDAIAQQLLDYMDYANMQDLVDVLMGCSMLDLTPCCEDLEYIKNRLGRLTGRASFRNHLLAKQGQQEAPWMPIAIDAGLSVVLFLCCCNTAEGTGKQGSQTGQQDKAAGQGTRAGQQGRAAGKGSRAGQQDRAVGYGTSDRGKTA
ncbi:hypothetical protein WJX82_000958 [Trebouxia sp. C0006]